MLKSLISLMILVSMSQMVLAQSSPVDMADQEVMATLGLQDISQPCVLKAKVQPEKQTQAYRTVSMKSILIGRDNDKGLARLTPNQLDHSRIVIKNQRIFTCMDTPMQDTPGEKITYVMDTAGNVYLFDEFNFKKVRHSSMIWKTVNGVVQGAEVAGAGEMKIKDQMIVFINSDSGHYPSDSVFKQVQSELSDVIVSGAGR